MFPQRVGKGVFPSKATGTPLPEVTGYFGAGRYNPLKAENGFHNFLRRCYTVEQTKLGRFWDRAREAFSSPYARKAILNTVSFLGGMLCSRGLVFGQIRAFGVAAVSSVPREGLSGRGAGGFPGVPAALPCRGACAVRGCHFGGDCHPVVPVGAERAEQSRAVRAIVTFLPCC